MDTFSAQHMPIVPEQTQILRVSQLTGIIKEILEGTFPYVTVEGEISNCRPSSTGHLYFTLKDETAAISAVMFKGKSRYLAFTPADGMLVKVSGNISVYAQRGTYQIVAESMEQSGEGDILQLLEQRKRKLEAEGLFDPLKKKPLPFFPGTVGVVTSPTGAALRDIIQIIRRRNSAVSITVLPCPVQGSEAAAGIVRQIETANRYSLADVLIVGRGGGSLEDLLPFSDETVVRAVAASEIPVISAVGHEIDWALSDYAADTRAPTPSAAAELAVPLLSSVTDNIASVRDTLYDEMTARTDRLRLMMRSFSADAMELRFRSIEQPLLMRFDDAKELLLDSTTAKISETRNRIAFITQALESANPENILAKGYSMVYDKASGKIIRSPQDTLPGTELEIYPAHGVICAQVTECRENSRTID